MKRNVLESIDTRVSRAARLLLWVVSLSAWALCASAQGANVSFGGRFEFGVITTQSDAFTLDVIEFGATLAVDAYSATVDATLTDTEFDTLRLSAAGPLGPLQINSVLSFNPSTLSFNAWQTGLAFSILEVDFADVFYVTTPPSSSYNQLSASWVVADLSFRSSARVGLCPLLYWDSSLCVDWPWDACETTVSACIEFNDAVGFRSLDLTVRDVTLFDSFLGAKWGLGLAFTYAVEEKTLTPTLQLQPDWFYCADIEILGEFEAGASQASVGTLTVYGIRGECAFSECLSFRFGESLAEEKNGVVTGKPEYFEMLGIAGCLPSCCGSDGSFDIAAYFEADGSALFDLALLTASASIQLASSVAFSFEAEFPTVGSGWQLKTLWSVTW